MNSQPKFTIQIGAKSYAIAWDNGALYRADLLGLPKRLASGKHGFATLCQMVWVMLDADARVELPEPEDVARRLSTKEYATIWARVLEAYAAGKGTDDSEPKNASGVSAPSPA